MHHAGQNAEPESTIALVEQQLPQSADAATAWLDDYGTHADELLSRRADVLAYEAAIAEDDPRQVLTYERRGAGYKADPAIAQPPTQLQLNEIPGYGWWGRPERESAHRAVDLQLTLIATRFASRAATARYIELTGEHASYCSQTEPDTLIYSGGFVTQDTDYGPGIKRDDFVFIALFANADAALTHRDDPQHLALQPKLAAIDKERVLLRTYRTSGRGFLWGPGA